ncbi:MAG: type II toxin-antitoxin system Phd/YefM family antitoxin [Beijerinckiaceae bacterium]
MKVKVLTVTSALFVAGCSGGQQRAPMSEPAAFDPKAAAYIHKSGSGVIQGETFIIGKNGKPVFAAGETIRLVPATAYARQRFMRLYKGRTFIPAGDIPRISPDPQYSKFTRTTVSSARGKFLFDSVAPGEYFVTSQKIIRPPGKFIAEGGAMYTRVTLTGQEKWPVRVVVADR